MSLFKPKTIERIIEKVVYSADPIELVNRLTNNDFKWYDYNELPQNERVKYYQQAQMVLNSDIFKNEIAKLNAEWAEYALKQSKNWEDLLSMRYQVSGIMLLKERLEGIISPVERKIEVKDPYGGI